MVSPNLDGASLELNCSWTLNLHIQRHPTIQIMHGLEQFCEENIKLSDPMIFRL